MDNNTNPNSDIFRNGAGIKQIYLGDKLIYDRIGSYIYIVLETMDKTEE